MKIQKPLGLESMRNNANVFRITPSGPTKEQDTEEEVLKGIGSFFLQKDPTIIEQRLDSSTANFTLGQTVCQCSMVVRAGLAHRSE